MSLEIENHNELKGRIQKVLTFDGPLLCSVKIKSGEQIVPKLVFGKSLEELAPFVSEDDLKNDLKFT